jgi:hypothetical protein
MKYILFLIYIFLYKSLSFEVNINNPSIVTLKYINNYSSPINVYINNLKYRESSLQPYNEGIFSINLNKGNYDFYFTNVVNYDIVIDEGKKINKEKDKLNSIILLKNKWNNIKIIHFFLDKITIIKFSSMFNFEILDKTKKIKYLVRIQLNNRIIYSSKINKKTFIYLSNEISLKPNYYNLKVSIYPINNVLCSCMTSNNGFEYGRHFTVWNIDKKNSIKYSMNVIIKDFINIKENNNINNINNNYIKYSLLR